jgi:hypothetical protein
LSLRSFAVSGLGLGPFDSLNMLLRSRVDDVPDLDSADHAAMDRRGIRPTSSEVLGTLQALVRGDDFFGVNVDQLMFATMPGPEKFD